VMQIHLISEMVKEGISDEQQDLMKVIKEISEPTPVIPAGKSIPEKKVEKKKPTVKVK